MQSSTESAATRPKEPDWGRYGLSEGVDIANQDDLVLAPQDGEQNELFHEDSVSDVTCNGLCPCLHDVSRCFLVVVCQQHAMVEVELLHLGTGLVWNVGRRVYVMHDQHLRGRHLSTNGLDGGE